MRNMFKVNNKDTRTTPCQFEVEHIQMFACSHLKLLTAIKHKDTFYRLKNSNLGFREALIQHRRVNVFRSLFRTLSKSMMNSFVKVVNSHKSLTPIYASGILLLFLIFIVFWSQPWKNNIKES